MLAGSGSGGVVLALLWGGFRRRSASRASSAARRQARSERSPSARACIRQAMRLTSQVRLLALVVSPKSSAKRCRSWPTLRRWSVATSLTMFGSTGFSLGLSGKSTRVNSEPQLAEKLKAIRDKKERFFSGEKWREEAGFLRRCPACKRQLAGRGGGAVTGSIARWSPKRPGVYREVSGVRDKP